MKTEARILTDDEMAVEYWDSVQFIFILTYFGLYTSNICIKKKSAQLQVY